MKARLGMAAGLWLEALTLLDHLCQVVKPKKSLELARCECLIFLGYIDQAQEVLQDEETLIEDSYIRDVLMARISVSQDRVDEAFSHLQAAMSRNPEDAFALAMGSADLAPLVMGAFHNPAITA